MTPEKRHEISSLGGKAIPREKRAFFRNRELAREAGRKGGLTPRRLKTKLTTDQINTLAEEILAKVPQGA